MAFGNQVAELKTKVTSRTIRETTSTHVRMDVNFEGQITGKLAGMIMYTVSATQYPDGTGSADVKVAVMGTEGEMASGTTQARGVMTSPGKLAVRGIVGLHSDHPKWSWLNNTPLALESVVELAAGTETARMYEWK